MGESGHTRGRGDLEQREAGGGTGHSWNSRYFHLAEEADFKAEKGEV